MYSDKKKSRAPLITCIVLLLIVIALACMWAVKVPAKSIDEEAGMAVKSAVERSAQQCYVVEGVYPPDIEYLRENYGLQVNTRDFYITYEAFSENLPPQVTVTKHK